MKWYEGKLKPKGLHNCGLHQPHSSEHKTAKQQITQTHEKMQFVWGFSGVGGGGQKISPTKMCELVNVENKPVSNNSREEFHFEGNFQIDIRFNNK